MRAWEEEYQAKLRTAQEAAQLIKSGEWFFSGTREPFAILDAIWQRTDLHDVHYYCGQVADPAAIFDSPAGKDAFVLTGFLSKKTLPYFKEGKLHYSPGHFSGASKRVEDYLKATTAIACVSRPDKDGYVSFGNSLRHIPA